MYQQITIKTLHNQGIKNISIAKQLNCHRNTVFNVIHRDKVIEKQRRTKPSVFEPYRQQIKEYLAKKITNLRIFEILGEEYSIKTTYVNLCKYIQKYFPKPPEAFGVQTSGPGETAEVDFGYLGMLPGPLGTLVKTYGLAVILNYSRVGYFAAVCDQKLATLIRELTNAFLYFGGVPKKLKVDNMKTAILKNQHYDLEFNQDFLEFANHCNTVIVPCSPYSPWEKGTVEAGIKYLQNNFVSGRTFANYADLKRQLTDWTNTYANLRVHGTTKKVPMEVFLASEKKTLQPLPREPFAFFNRGVRTISANCHIHFENNYYSVPSALVGKEVTVRWNETLLRIISEGEQVALHIISQGSGNYVTVRSHLPSYKTYSETEHQARYETQFADIGEDAHSFFRNLLKTKETYWGRIARIILGFKAEYGVIAVNASLRRALYYQAWDTITIKNILEKKLYELEPEPKLLNRVNTDDEFTRELSYYSK